MKRIAGIIFALSITFLPMGAYAALTGLSFGGKVFYSYPCTCTAGTVYYIIVGPPSMIALTYVIGTQGYSLYSLPYGRQILGLYNPFINSTCIMGFYPYCYTLYSAGQIMPMVGSSL